MRRAGARPPGSRGGSGQCLRVDPSTVDRLSGHQVDAAPHMLWYIFLFAFFVCCMVDYSVTVVYHDSDQLIVFWSYSVCHLLRTLLHQARRCRRRRAELHCSVEAPDFGDRLTQIMPAAKGARLQSAAVAPPRDPSRDDRCPPVLLFSAHVIHSGLRRLSTARKARPTYTAECSHA